MHLVSLLSGLTALLAATSVAAQQQGLTRCQCSYEHWVADCKASVELRGNWFKVTSSTQQCSRVDWYANENPQVTIVADGAEMEQWLGQSPNPKITIQSCKICRDANYAGAGARPPEPGGQQPPVTAQPVSSFQGNWQGSERNIFGISNPTKVTITVTGNQMRGTWQTGKNQASSFSGTVTGDEADFRIEGSGQPNSYKMRLSGDTLTYSFPPFGSGTLQRVR